MGSAAKPQWAHRFRSCISAGQDGSWQEPTMIIRRCKRPGKERRSGPQSEGLRLRGCEVNIEVGPRPSYPVTHPRCPWEGCVWAEGCWGGELPDRTRLQVPPPGEGPPGRGTQPPAGASWSARARRGYRWHRAQSSLVLTECQALHWSTQVWSAGLAPSP